MILSLKLAGGYYKFSQLVGASLSMYHVESAVNQIVNLCVFFNINDIQVTMGHSQIPCSYDPHNQTIATEFLSNSIKMLISLN